jgi:hypothetical protein
MRAIVLALAFALAFALTMAAGCGFGGPSSGSKSSSGSGIDADAGALDGALHPGFDGQGDAAVDVVPDQETQDTAETTTPVEDTGVLPDGEPCTPNCAGKECGDDGCGLSCGQCTQETPFCVDGVCADCIPDCVGKLCGDDLCGGSCGLCVQGGPCIEGLCICQPLCDEATCGGPDGCAGTCPPCTDTLDAGSSDIPDGGSSPDAADATPDADTAGSVSDGGPIDGEDGDGISDADATPDVPPDVPVDAIVDGEVAIPDADATPDVPPDVPVDAIVDGEVAIPDADATPDVPPDVPADGTVDAADAADASDIGEDGDAPGLPDAVEDAEVAPTDADAAPEVNLPPPPPAPTELVLTEIMRAPLDGAFPGRQWLELASVVNSPREIGGCQIIDANGTSWTLPGSLVTEPYGRLVFGEEGSVTDGLILTDATYPTVAAGGPDLAVIGPISFVCSTGIIDTVHTAAIGETGPFPNDVGYAMQLAPGFTSTLENDAPEAWCNAETTYGVAGYGSPGKTNHPCDSGVDWCRLWSPAFQLSDAGVPWEATGHLYQAGLTDITSGAPDFAPGLMAQVGYGPDGLDPLVAPGEWIWFTAAAVEDPPPAVPSTDDRYTGVITIPVPGVYDVAARFSLDGGFTWTVCDLDGSADGYELTNTGHATIL